MYYIKFEKKDAKIRSENIHTEINNLYIIKRFLVGIVKYVIHDVLIKHLSCARKIHTARKLAVHLQSIKIE